MFRFTIRDVLWLTVVVALGIGLALQRSQLERTRGEASQSRYRLERLVAFLSHGGYRVMWDDETGTPGFVCTDPYLRRASDGLTADPGPLPKITLPRQ